MKYKNIAEGIFLERPNRFIAKVQIKGEIHTVHVKNTGRCKELLKPGSAVYLEKSDNQNRKTKYDLVAAVKERENLPSLLINLDSQIPNDVAAEWLRESGLFSPDATVKREVVFGNSRFDFYIEDKDRKAFVEVKGVTQEYGGTAMFPDAPTERGVKHLEELIKCKEQGYEAYVLFIVQMKGITRLIPNDETHKAFGDALRKAQKSGVKILAVEYIVTPDSIQADAPVPVKTQG